MIKQTSVAVYGAGVSGLIAAYFLNKKGFLVSVVDPYNEPKIKTLKVPEGIVEHAANSILFNDEVKALVEDIGLDYELYSDLGKKKFIFINDSPKRWPLNFMETLRALRPLFSLAKKKEHTKPKKGETVADWGQRVLGLVALEKLMLPGLQGVYGGDTGALSASLVLKNIFIKKKKKSLGSISFKGGMEEFTRALKKALEDKGVEFVKELAAQKVQTECKSKENEISLQVVSTPSHSLPDMVSSKTKELLAQVSYKEVSTLTVFVKESDRMNFKGFGCVFKGQENGVVGLILNSDLFDGRAEEGLVSETWILNGQSIKTKEKALETIERLRSKKFNRVNQIVNSYFKYWEKAFPSYDLNLEDVLTKLQEEKEVHFFANWTGGLGIGSMIQNAPEFVNELIKKEGL